MTFAVLAFSARGEILAKTLGESLRKRGNVADIRRCGKGQLKDWVREHVDNKDALVFIASCGIAVRAIAPFIKDKTSDPAVIVIDETGKFVISLLSGHIGGANRLTQRLAEILDATPVITTATDMQGVFAVDSWASEQGMKLLHPEKIVEISSRLLEGKPVFFRSDYPVEGDLPEHVVTVEREEDFLISHRKNDRSILQLIPPVVSLGVGCRKGTSIEKIESAFERILRKSGILEESVFQVASIELKKNEPGLLEFCKKRNIQMIFYSAEELAQLQADVSSSDFVQSVTGVDNVCERSALLGAGEESRLIQTKEIHNGVTMALAVRPYTVKFEERE